MKPSAGWTPSLATCPVPSVKFPPLMILIGAAMIVYMRIASWRIIAGVMVGMVATSPAVQRHRFRYQPHVQHAVALAPGAGWLRVRHGLHGDRPRSPLPSPTRAEWWYGALIGVMVVLIRVVNPAFPEGMMLAILFANLFAPLFDHFVAQANIKRRIARGVLIKTLPPALSP